MTKLNNSQNNSSKNNNNNNNIIIIIIIIIIIYYYYYYYYIKEKIGKKSTKFTILLTRFPKQMCFKFAFKASNSVFRPYVKKKSIQKFLAQHM